MSRIIKAQNVHADISNVIYLIFLYDAAHDTFSGKMLKSFLTAF